MKFFSIISPNHQDKFALLWRDLTLVEGGTMLIIAVVVAVVLALVILALAIGLCAKIVLEEGFRYPW